MPGFTYQGVDISGSNEIGSIEAKSEKVAFDILQSRGITVFELSESNIFPGSHLPWYRRDIKFRSRQLAYEDQATTADLLATLFSAGISTAEVIRIAALSSEKTIIKRHFERVGQRVADGTSFADAFKAENQLFSPIFTSFLQVSDTTNTLPRILKSLGLFFQKQSIVSQKIISALIYPAILVCAAIAMLLVVVLYLAPNLGPIFSSVGKEPPGTLSLLLSINATLRDYWLIILGVVAGFFPITFALLQFQWVKSVFSRLKYQLPIFGNLARVTTLSRLSQATGLLLSSGQPLSEALRTAALVMGGTSSFGKRFYDAANAIDAGLTASAVFDEDPNIPHTFKELFRIGEKTNRLPYTMAALSETMVAQVDKQSQRLLNLLTPTLTLVLGLGIGFLIYTLMEAILEVNELAY